jgi:hypothetical protein
MKALDIVFKVLDWVIPKTVDTIDKVRDRKEAKKKAKEIAILKARARQKAKDAKESGKIYDIDPEKYEVD